MKLELGNNEAAGDKRNVGAFLGIEILMFKNASFVDSN